MDTQVQFEEPRLQYPRIAPERQTPAFVRKLITMGVVQNENQAYYILLGIIIFGLFGTLWFMGWFPFTSRRSDSFGGTQIRYQEDIPPHVLSSIPAEVLKFIPHRPQ